MDPVPRQACKGGEIAVPAAPDLSSLGGLDSSLSSRPTAANRLLPEQQSCRLCKLDRTLAGKRVLVTGGARRVGAALVRAFASSGAMVTIHFHHSQDEAAALLASLPGSGHRMIQADLASAGEVDALIGRAGSPVDILVNNASLYGRDRSLLAGGDIGDRDYFEVNYFAPVNLIRRFAAQPELIAGAVVNLLDQEVGRATPEGGAYSHSRRALRDATLEFARLLAPRIRVNGVAPGPVLPPAWISGAGMEHILADVPAGKPVPVAELAETVLFLAGAASITGQIVYVDGGQHLNG